MPMYEYRCKRCGHEFEELVFGNTVPSCPSCHAQDTEKLLSRPCLHCGNSEGFSTTPSAGMGGGMRGGGGCAGCSGGSCASCH